jgi:hypothetical protein
LRRMRSSVISMSSMRIFSMSATRSSYHGFWS